MKKIAIPWIALLKFCIVLMVPVFALAFPSQAAAADCIGNPFSLRVSGMPTSFSQGSRKDIVITISNIDYLPDATYQLQVYEEGDIFRSPEATSNPVTKSVGVDTLTFTIPDGEALISDGADIVEDDHYVYLYTSTGTNTCEMGYYYTTPPVPHCDDPIKVVQTRNVGGTETTCQAGSSSCMLDSKDISVSATVKNEDGSPYSGPVHMSINSNLVTEMETVSNGNLSFTITPSYFSESSRGVLTLKLYAAKKDSGYMGMSNGIGQFRGGCSSFTINYRPACNDTTPGSCSTTPPPPPSDNPDIPMEQRVFQLCTQISNDGLKIKCDSCYKNEGVWTAVGCVSRKPQSIVRALLEVGLGLGGGICLLMCLAGGFMLTTSQGDPKQVGEAREMITSAIIGLLFIIFSVFILQFIGVTILNIPGFGTTVPAP